LNASKKLGRFYRSPTCQIICALKISAKGVYSVDLASEKIISTTNAPVPVNCGFALLDDAVYFGSKAELWRYVLPSVEADQSSRERK